MVAEGVWLGVGAPELQWAGLRRAECAGGLCPVRTVGWVVWLEVGGIPEPHCSPQLVLAEGAHSDAGSQATDGHGDLPPPLERMGGIGDSRPPSFQ